MKHTLTSDNLPKIYMARLETRVTIPKKLQGMLPERVERVASNIVHSNRDTSGLNHYH
jgi:hypothetical protein